MPTAQDDFEIGTAEDLGIGDMEITELLRQVYVEGGHTSAAEAATLFEPSALRKRGTLLGARDKNSHDLAGMIIVVPPDSPARRLTETPGGELHLLGVKQDYRGRGLGRRLLDTAIDRAIQMDCRNLSLWTQVPMKAAQKMYESAGFVHVRDFERNGRDFKVYERALSAWYPNRRN